MEIVGGATSGYWAMGSLTTATTPMITMTIDKTMAMIGRSMKKRDICYPLKGRHHEPGNGFFSRHQHGRSLPRYRFARHFPLGGTDRHSRPGAIHALDDDPLCALQTGFDHAQSALLKSAGRCDVDALHGVPLLLVHHEHVFEALVGKDRAISQQDGLNRLPDGDANPREQARCQLAVSLGVFRILKPGASLDRTGRRVDAVVHEIHDALEWKSRVADEAQLDRNLRLGLLA